MHDSKKNVSEFFLWLLNNLLYLHSDSELSGSQKPLYFRTEISNNNRKESHKKFYNLFFSEYIYFPKPNTIVTVNEGQTVTLKCNPITGLLLPSFNWTKDGVIVKTGSSLTTPALNHNDNNECYTCTAYNGIVDAKTANFCMNVQCKYHFYLTFLWNRAGILHLSIYPINEQSLSCASLKKQEIKTKTERAHGKLQIYV